MFEELGLSVAQLVPIAAVLIGTAVLRASGQKLTEVYSKFVHVFSSCGLTGIKVAKNLLDRASIEGVSVDVGPTQNHYDWRRKKILLRSEVAASQSLLAVAVASHEVAHAEQFAQGHWAAHCYRFIWWFRWIAFGGLGLLLVHDISQGNGLASANLILGIAAAFILVYLSIVLAMESDANLRARRLTQESGLLTESEWDGFDQVLRSGWITYLSFAAQQCLIVGAVAASLMIIRPMLDGPDEQITAVTIADEIQPAMEPVALFDFGGGAVLALMLAGLLVMWFVWSNRPKSQTGNTVASEINNLGQIAFTEGRLEEAVAQFDEAIRLDPSLAAAHYNRSVTMATMGNMEQATQSIDSMFACPPSTNMQLLAQFDPWLCRATVRSAKDDWNGAESDFTAAIERGCTYSSAFRDRGLARLMQQRYEEAIADSETAISKDPKDGVAFNNLGFGLIKLGRFADAIDALNTSAELTPELPNPHKHLAKLYHDCPVEKFRNAGLASHHAAVARRLGDTDDELAQILATTQQESQSQLASSVSPS